MTIAQFESLKATEGAGVCFFVVVFFYTFMLPPAETFALNVARVGI